MTYSGDVRVGGPADVRELPGLVLSKIAVGPMSNNSYLLRCRETGQQVLIDAAADPEALLDLIGDDGIEAVVTTHRHADHWQALGAVVAATGATTVAGRHDAKGIPVASDVLLDDGDEIAFGSVVLRAIHLIGHTPGSIALLYDDPEGQPHLFTG
ncbi:MAG: MBL fold metallo-hydrolase, partial [Candidatus Nanopelagicales bacterium]